MLEGWHALWVDHIMDLKVLSKKLVIKIVGQENFTQLSKLGSNIR